MRGDGGQPIARGTESTEHGMDRRVSLDKPEGSKETERVLGEGYRRERRCLKDKMARN